MKILAIESSCDETAAAVIQDGTKILSSVVASSKAMHEKYGGIVPEVAAREQLLCVLPTIKEALKKANADYSSIDRLAVTVGPGLIGSLLVGVETAKTIAFATGLPIIPVNHVLAHMYANFIQHANVIPGSTRNPSSISNTGSRLNGRDDKERIQFPAISLVVSGGHTELYLMTSPKHLTWLGGTLDDAAGEAFDKTARLLGFGHGGGPAIQDAAKKIKRTTVSLPRPLNDSSLNFSFSGLKTAVMRQWNKQKEKNEEQKNMFAHEIQESITDILVKKTIHAATAHGAKSILLSGGVAANLRLREKFQTTINDLRSTISFYVPPAALCTDNAVYIASYAYFRGTPVDWHELTAIPDLSVEE